MRSESILLSGFDGFFSLPELEARMLLLLSPFLSGVDCRAELEAIGGARGCDEGDAAGDPF